MSDIGTGKSIEIQKYPLSEASPFKLKLLVWLPTFIFYVLIYGAFSSQGSLISYTIEQIGAGSLYALAVAAVALTRMIAGPIIGSFSDIFGRKTMAIATQVIMCVSTLICWLTSNFAFFLFGYAISGFAQGGLAALNTSLISDVLPEKDRPRFLSWTITGENLLGIVIPNIIAWVAVQFGNDYQLSNGVCTIMPAIGILVIALFYPNIKSKDKIVRHVDWTGLLLLFTTLSPFAAALTLGGKFFPWFGIVFCVLIVICIVSCILLIRHLKRASEPIIDLKLFNIRGYLPCIIVVMLTYPTVILISSYVIRYAQQVLGFTAVQTTQWLIRRFIPVILTPVIGVLLSKSQRYKFFFILGGFIEAISVLMLFGMSPTIPSIYILICLCLFQGGTVFENTPSKVFIANVLTPENRTSGSSLLSFFSSAIQTICAAIYGMIVNIVGLEQGVYYMIAIALIFLAVRQFVGFRFLPSDKKA